MDIRTALLINGQRIVATTHVENNKTIIIMANADENYLPMDNGKSSVFEHEDTEEEFHKTLRREAYGVGHLVKQYCTHPEFFPINQIESIDEKQS
jgi:hypothetical protein